MVKHEISTETIKHESDNRQRFAKINFLSQWKFEAKISSYIPSLRVSQTNKKTNYSL